ncbi:MAG: NYN domain-containing protein [Candidatus Thiodiazotropha endolucinida]
MTEQDAKQRAIVYIDGYNLYYGQRTAFGDRYKWLDLQAFSESFLRPGMELVAVKYFTAITKSTTGSRQRQEIYLKALRAHCARLEVFYGRFLSKSKRCRNCGAEHTAFEEKKTDVNIACEILNDTHLDRYDCCYVVSGDSDLVPPLKIVKENHPDKRAIVAHPPRRKSAELCQVADGWFAIGKQRFKNNQLPEKVVSTHSGELVRPAEWK